jgi:hypothetical protein
MKRSNLALVASAILALLVGGSSALAAPSGNIWNSVAVCDPNSPTHCAAPDSSGNLPISGSITATFTNFTPTGAASLSVSNVSGRVALPNTDATVIIQNTGTVNAFFKLGDGSVTAATTDYSLPAGTWIAVKITTEVDLAAITAASTTTFKVIQGTGTPQMTGGGGSGGGAITAASGSYASGALASGSMVDIGAQADAACGTASGTCSLISLVKYLLVNGITPFGQAASASSLPVVTANNEPNIGVPGATACATDTGSCTLNALLQRIAQRLTTVIAGIPVTNAGTFATQAAPTPVTSGGLSVYFVQPAASDNHVVIKAGAGQVYKITAMNNSATVNYLRLYNATTGFNGCNSATNLVYQGQIPASTTVGGLSDSWDLGMAFSTGISICVTSGYATTDTTNATASAMSVNIGYK